MNKNLLKPSKILEDVPAKLEGIVGYPFFKADPRLAPHLQTRRRRRNDWPLGSLGLETREIKWFLEDSTLLKSAEFLGLLCFFTKSKKNIV